MKKLAILLFALSLSGCTVAIDSKVCNINQPVKSKNIIRDRNVHDTEQVQPNG